MGNENGNRELKLKKVKAIYFIPKSAAVNIFMCNIKVEFSRKKFPHVLGHNECAQCARAQCA